MNLGCVDCHRELVDALFGERVSTTFPGREQYRPPRFGQSTMHSVRSAKLRNRRPTLRAIRVLVYKPLSQSNFG